tara:strand:+ start:5433 stop:6704 length:1272 start_codon:yes stop_codon:yes gene_type:complete
MLKNKKISIIGQGYVGLPLTIELGKKYKNIIGFDNSKKRILEIKKLKDANKEIKKEDFYKAKKAQFTYDVEKISKSDFFIITVPTPIDKKNKPDLSNLISATKTVAQNIKKSSIIIYESTVYPGCTEEVCVPILEKYSKLKFNKDFFCGYSPERINVGDTSHTLTKIKKVVSGSSFYSTKKINQLYKSIINAGTYVAKSIKVAEAAKVIENTQRDLNIALINELSMIFNKINIDTNDVLDTANTKWNFIKYKPGLVGGHCIGVDPYYLTYKSKKVGHTPKIIQAGRKVNDNMSKYIANRTLKLLDSKKINYKKTYGLILGCAFKKNCTDTRNSKTFELAKNLESSKIKIDIYDPWVDYFELRKQYKLNFIDKIKKRYDFIIMTVSHNNFKKFTPQKLKKIVNKKNIIFDVTGILNRKIISERL